MQSLYLEAALYLQSPLMSFYACITLQFLEIHTVPSNRHFIFGTNKSLYHNSHLQLRISHSLSNTF